MRQCFATSSLCPVHHPIPGLCKPEDPRAMALYTQLLIRSTLASWCLKVIKRTAEDSFRSPYSDPVWAVVSLLGLES